MLKSETVVVDDQTFEVKELTIGQLVDILPRLTGDDPTGAQVDMLKMSVYQNGVALGEEVCNLGVSTYMPLLNAAMKVNGLGNDE